MAVLFGLDLNKKLIISKQGGFVNLIEEHAREKVNAPPEWSPYHYEWLPKDSTRKEVLEVRGCIKYIISRGKNKGKRGWMKKEFNRTTYITPDENEKWCKEWEKKTGLCSHCKGSGKVANGWNIETGIRYKQCSECNGMGKVNKP